MVFTACFIKELFYEYERGKCMRRRFCLVLSGILLICVLSGCAGEKEVPDFAAVEETVMSTESTVVDTDEASHMPQTDEASHMLQSEPNIYINEIDTEPLLSGSMPDLGEENFQEMTREEVLNYFGVELAMEIVLPDMTEVGEGRYGFYQFADGSVLDQQAFSFQSAEETLHIVMRGEKLPIHSLGNSSEFDISEIFGHEALLIHFTDASGKDIYYAESITDKVGMTIHYRGNSEEDFVKIVEYLLCQ